MFNMQVQRIMRINYSSVGALYTSGMSVHVVITHIFFLINKRYHALEQTLTIILWFANNGNIIKVCSVVVLVGIFLPTFEY